MREIRGEAWELKDNYTYLALTTNGTLKKHKAAVMGRGIALQAKNKYRGLENEVGIRVYSQGNVVQKLNIDKLIMFPVKHNWWECADLELIKRSCLQLLEVLDEDETCLLPRPGCGNGNLRWLQVKDAIKHILDDRVTIVTY